MPHQVFFGPLLANGPDGNVWFEASAFNPSTAGNDILIGKVTPAGQVTEYPRIPVPNGGEFTDTGVASGPGGDLWFGDTDLGAGHFHPFPAETSVSYIGRVTTAGAVTVFPLPDFGCGPRTATLQSIAAGADRNLWFTEDCGIRTVLGRISPSGTVTRSRIGNLDFGSVANGPNGSIIAFGQDARGQNEVFGVSAAGALSRYKIPAAISRAFVNYLGPVGGSTWFANGESAPLKIGRIMPSGGATSYQVPRYGPSIFKIAMAPGRDGNLYLLDTVKAGANAIVYRLSPGDLTPVRGVGRPRS